MSEEPPVVPPEQYAGEDEPGPDANRAVEASAEKIETASDVGEAAIEATTQIPVSDESVKEPLFIPHVGGMNAPEGDPAYVDSNSPTVVDDVEKAHSMALAGNENRTEAGHNRGLNRQTEAYREEYSELRNDQRYLRPKRPWRKERLLSKWGVDTLEGLRSRYPELSAGDRWSYVGEDAREIEHEVRTGEKSEKLIRWRRERMNSAIEVDRKAQELERWAGILHDHSVSEEYKVKHPDFGFGPESMIELEKWVGIEQGEGPGSVEDNIEVELGKGLYDVENELEYADEIASEISELIDRIYEEGKRDEDLYVQWEKEVSDEEDVEGLKRFYKKIHPLLVKAYKANAAERKQVLEDVLSGRASQPPEPEAKAA